MTGLVATATTTIEATKETVWKALTDPDEVMAWFFGTDQRTDWKPGSPITWTGEWDGKPYEDKGEVLAVDEPNRFEVTHWSPLTGTPDVPESYHTLVYALREARGPHRGLDQPGQQRRPGRGRPQRRLVDPAPRGAEAARRRVLTRRGLVRDFSRRPASARSPRRSDTRRARIVA